MQTSTKLLFFFLLLSLTVSDTAIVTYHLYSKYDSLTTVACSDGSYGLMSWGYKDISNMFPYVTAWQSAKWNSPQCGNCAKIMWKGKYSYVTVIDMCGVINSAYSHFDMSKQSFYGLFGDLGIARGTMTANFTMVASRYCPGNRKGVISNVPVNYQQSAQTLNIRSETQDQMSLWEKQQSSVRSNQNIDKSEDKSQRKSVDNTQNKQSQQNPLWVKTQSATSEKLNYQKPQEIESYEKNQASDVNESQIEGQQESSDNEQSWKNEQEGYQEQELEQEQEEQQDLELIRTEYGGFSYDKQNEINEKNANDNF